MEKQNYSKIFIVAILFFTIGTLAGIMFIAKINEIFPISKSAIECKSCKSDNEETISGTITFRTGVYDKDNFLVPVANVNLAILDQNGKLVAKALTDEKGEARVNLTVPVDKRFEIIPEQGQINNRRASITVASFKEGYTETVIVDVSFHKNLENSWEIAIDPIRYYNEAGIEINRDSPHVIFPVGVFTHHLEASSFIDAIAKLAGFKVFGRY